jgi:nitroreductase
VALGPGTGVAPPVAGLDPIDHPTLPLSSSEVDFPLLREIHTASSLGDPEAVRAWRARGATSTPASVSSPRSDRVALPPPRPQAGRGLGETIQRRGSTRQFARVPLTAEELATALWAATRGIDGDYPAGRVDPYLIVNAVDGVPSGSYAYDPEARALTPLASGDFRNRSSYLCLEQPLGGDAAAVIYFLARLDATLGERGYRVANLAAGLAGGRAYLAAYGLGFGASGLTFYDAHVVEFFSPHAGGKDAIFVTALGRSAAGGRVTIDSTLTLRRPSA